MKWKNNICDAHSENWECIGKLGFETEAKA